MKYFIITVDSIQEHEYEPFTITPTEKDCYMARVSAGEQLEIFKSFSNTIHPAYIRSYNKENWTTTKSEARTKAIQLRKKAIRECQKRILSLKKRIWKLQDMEEYLLPIDK